MSESIYYNGEIHLFDQYDHIYEAIAMKDGKIIATGSNNEVLKYQKEETEVIDLHQKTILPGFIDAHLHIFSTGFNLANVNCQLSSIEEVVDAIKERAQQTTNENEWIIGAGFDESLYKEARKINKWDLEEIKNPVYITRYCLHEAVTNKTGLDIAGITKQTEIKNGIIERDNTGEVNGLLKENAMTLIEDVLPAYTIDRMKEAIQLANDHMVKNGITSAHDAGLGFFVDPYKEFEVLKQVSEEGQLDVKMYLMILAEHFKSFLKKNEHAETEKLKFGSMKLFADGTLSGKTAALLKPYKNSHEKGMLIYSEEELAEYVRVAHNMDKQVAIHAIGSRAVDQVLRVYESVNSKYSRRKLRHRIEHTTITNNELIKKMKKLNVTPIPQPTLIHMAGDKHNEVIDRTDKELKYFAFHSYLDNNLKPAGSSDSPVVNCNPLLGIYSAMERRTVRNQVFDEEERLSLKDAVRMYTLYAAHAAFEEDTKGSLEIGKSADFVVLPEGFMDYSSSQVKKAQVEKTVINGAVVYEKNII